MIHQITCKIFLLQKKIMNIFKVILLLATITTLHAGVINSCDINTTITTG